MSGWRQQAGRVARGAVGLAALRWGAAALLVTGMHGAGVWMALNWVPAAAATGGPPPAVMIDLAPMAVAAEAPPQDVAPGPQLAETQPEPTPETPEPPVEEPPPEPEPVPEPVSARIEEQLPPPPLPLPPPEFALPKTPEVPAAEAVLPPPPPPRPEIARKPPPPPKPRKVVERRKPVERDRPPVTRTTAPPASAAAPAAARSAAPAPGTALAPSVSPASWRGALVAHLNRHKRFPSGAAAGTVTVSFTINRAGAVIGTRLVASSGDPLLDAEALSLPRRASPLPEPPGSIAGGTIALAVPIRFSR